MVAELEGQIVFEPEFRNPDALRGMEGFDYLFGRHLCIQFIFQHLIHIDVIQIKTELINSEKKAAFDSSPKTSPSDSIISIFILFSF